MHALHCCSLSLWRTSRSSVQKVDSNLAASVGLACVTVAIAFFYWPVTRWTFEKFLQSSLHWHWFVALLALLCALRANTHRLQPGANTAATVLLFLCIGLEALNRSTLDIQLLSAVLLIVTIHAFSGLLISNQRWRSMKWPMVVGIALLPLDFYLEPYLGYPLRFFTASVAGALLHGMGFDALTSQSILLVENRASVVDLDCSGINSLWAGAVFYLLLSWLTRLAVGLRWFLSGLLLTALLLTSNVFRIVVLVVLDLNDLTGLSEIAHTSLGALGFSVSILIVWKLTERLSTVCEPNQSTANDASFDLLWRWPIVPVIAVVLIAAVLPASQQNRVPQKASKISLPVSLASSRIELSKPEQRFFNQSGAIAVKYQLGPKSDSDSLVLVTSNYWKAQHKPDHCLQSMGFRIVRSRVLTVDSVDSFNPISAVTILDLIDENHQRYTSVYWFQSRDVTTADHYWRMADSIRHPNRNWTMASLLLNGERDVREISEKVAPVQQAILTSLKEPT